MSSPTPAVVHELAQIVGAAHVLTDPDTTAGYVVDWTGRWHGRTGAVVRPGSTAEVAAVLAACSRFGAKVVPQGGNTGLVGGSIPMDGEIVLSTLRLTTIEHVDPVDRTLAAGAGVTIAQAQQAARRHGLDFGIDLASRDSATLGGIVATNAGGVRVIKNGDTRSQLLGVEAVLSDGRVLTRWKELTKDNVGYDLPGLLAGSEGTLAVITRVLMRLIVPPPHTLVALVAVPKVGDALRLVDRLERAGLTVEAAELMTGPGVELVCRHQRLRPPLAVEAPFLLLVEVAGQPDTRLAEILRQAGESVLDATIDEGPAPRLWRYRESHTESISAQSRTPVVKLDVSTPLREIEQFLQTLTAEIATEFVDVRTVCFGHVADGNLHINLLDVGEADRDAVTDLVLRHVVRHGGSISAEHGVGRAKAPWLELGRTAADIDLMKAIRAAIDPAGLLNPQVLPAR
ncbi:FAD-binding oxidoreductase [Mycobacterium sp.]|uniref:FAD-binding oxidoreductase n=1 Tax=Mycobacterium sp. TaxID=1785 RepID=UPI0031D7DFCA